MRANTVYNTPPGFKVKSHNDARLFLTTIVDQVDNISVEDNGKTYDLWRDNSGWHLFELKFSNDVVGIGVEMNFGLSALTRFIYKHRKQINKEFFSGR